ncbi:PREDICTED: uncharacterized protein LOC105313517 [Amphimedon queenslandica]|uniref:Lysine-specific metallo-endopeptidase domain-containing protein n=1 Tax=Amphimedon queenslandica TaxID=400682 RepID=A0A1X7UEY2_AMPQE|nr:PREDICTED: uncharacterized protein LOC105313517 [Amphimedon queenslandica]|eukprot:XP_011405316.1 PREDICTED: uncharacterized protein LOC105313517 [Amphimedon queenslandica]
MKTLLSLFCLVTYLTCALSANGWPVSLDMACDKALSAVACSFEFTNNANEDLYLLKRNTPLEGLYSQFVSVSLDGRPLEYEGIYIYRLPPTKDEFALLKAGESISASVQITDAFSINTDGLYTVQYSRPLQYLSVNEMNAMFIDQLKDSSACESVHIYLEGTDLFSRPKEQKVELDYTVYIESCTAANFNGSRDNDNTLEAHKRLCAGIDKAKGGVGNNNLYVTWFGAYTAARANTVKDLYGKMRTGLGSKTVTYYNNGPKCKDHPNAIAYTYKSYSQTVVYLCDYFYKEPIACKGTSYTKERTLLHEWAHAFAARDDEGYGPDKCKGFAKSDPAKAIRNADNFSYHYCESQ